jgi:large subunit ribosomal protein L14e
VDGPTTGVSRQPLNFRRLTLTDFTIRIPHGIRTGGLKKALEKDDVIAKFHESTWGKRLKARKIKQNTTDFDRFKTMIAKKRARVLINTSVKALKKTK